MAEFASLLAETASSVETCLDFMLGPAPLGSEVVRPPRLLAAMRHAMLGGGKRFRPFLTIETARLFGITDTPLRVGAAIECLHGYSLVHDDLPAMDDDDLRRGRPTVHIAFDEAMAILAGDALQTFAFDILADPATHPDAAIRADLVLGLARAAGMGGMVGGQVMDIEAESGNPDEDAINRMQAMKTGALIRFSCEAGAILGRASVAERMQVARFGTIIGLAFQLADDLLDATGDAAAMGKAAAKDAARGKGTFVALHGVDAAKRRLGDLVEAADQALTPFGDRADTLKDAARFVAERRA